MVDQTAAKLLKEFVEFDKKRKESVFGNKNGEQALMRLCEFMKTNSAALTDQGRKTVLDGLRSMNLLPYRSYCREHLLDIGITNV
jgi:uncharacterized protein YfeS